MVGRHLIKSWSSTQTSISLSSGEAEYYGVVRASGVALGYQSLLRDLGVCLRVRVWTDSSATIGICGRQGLGKLRHIDTQCLWVQQRVRDGSIELRKVKGEVNPADLFTKHLSSGDRIKSLLELFGCGYQPGRAASAPKLREGAGTTAGEMLHVEAYAGPTVAHEGRVFPAVFVDGERTPDAYLHDVTRLPHQHEHLDELFPRAIAAAGPGDQDLDGPDLVGERGVERGRQGS